MPCTRSVLGVGDACSKQDACSLGACVPMTLNLFCGLNR